VSKVERWQDCPDCYDEESCERCFNCNGTGQLCNTCGEARDVCKCDGAAGVLDDAGKKA